MFTVIANDLPSSSVAQVPFIRSRDEAREQFAKFRAQGARRIRVYEGKPLGNYSTWKTDQLICNWSRS